MNHRHMRHLLLAAAGGAIVMPAPARAQDAVEGDIIVTARKRDESLISVPVAVTAVGGVELERRAINDLNSLTQFVPALQIGSAGGSIQGGTIVMRGIGGSENNPLADQSVSFNIDGAQIARSTVQRMSEMDVAQIEVLKGPQALFFGKNSPGGIISIRTADPGPDFEAKATAGYEFNAREIRADGYISGPLTETLGARLAVFGTGMRGWVTNIIPRPSPYANTRRHVPNNREFAGRFTLKFTPSDRFDARLKVTYNHLKGQGPEPNGQYVFCPKGGPSFGDVDECRPNKRVLRPSIGPNFSALDPDYRDGVPYVRQKQWLGSLEMNYKLSDELTFTSLSSVYDMFFENMDNFTRTANPAFILPAANQLELTELSQEVRLASDFDFPLNFLVGAYYQDSTAENQTDTHFNALAPVQINNYAIRQKGEAYSAFGQLTWDIAETLELAGGGRYSHEKKRIRIRQAGTPVVLPVDHDSWNNFSPEVTLTWRPTTRMTVYGGYKRGFLSGGFNGGGGALAVNRSFDQQTVRGFEGGLKAALLDGMLRTNFSLYNYQIRGLQVATTIVTGGQINQVVTNAGKSRTKGFEFDATLTPAEGLTLRGGIAYTRARYNIFNLACHRGQTFALGCNIETAPGVFTRQDLAGKQIVRSPDWTGNAGIAYEAPVGGKLVAGASLDASYSSSYDTAADRPPGSRMDSFWLLDGTLRLFNDDRSWEIALIGRNLTNEYYWTRSTQLSFTGTAPGAPGASSFADIIATVSRGRQIMLRGSVKFGGR